MGKTDAHGSWRPLEALGKSASRKCRNRMETEGNPQEAMTRKCIWIRKGETLM